MKLPGFLLIIMAILIDLYSFFKFNIVQIPLLEVLYET